MSLSVINKYLRMIKFSHSIFALPFALIAFLEALPGSGLINSGKPTYDFYVLLIKIIIAMVAMRSAAMGYNRLADRKFDAANPRTANREIPSGEISERSAALFIIISLLIVVAVAFSINFLCGILSPVAFLVVLGYSLTKRFTFLCHYVLGLAIGAAPAAAYLAVHATVQETVLYWSFGLMFYIAGFDILYSMQDEDFDRSAGLHSIPSRFGSQAALWWARYTHTISLFFMILAVQTSGRGIYAIVALMITGALFFMEHYLVMKDKKNIPVAFFHINAVISLVLFAGLLLDHLTGQKIS